MLVSIYKNFNVRDLFSDYSDLVIAAILYKHVNHETLKTFDGVIDIFDSREDIVHKLVRIIESKNINTNLTQLDIELSKREKEIATLAAQGFKSREIADKLHISLHTVVTHRTNISRKIGVNTVSGLTMYAMLNQLIPYQ